MVNIQISIKVIHHVDIIKDRSGIIILIEKEKAFDTFMEKEFLNQPYMVRRKGSQPMKSIHHRPTADIIYCSEIPNAFPIRLRARQGCLLPPSLHHRTTGSIWRSHVRKRSGNVDTLERKIHDHTETWCGLTPPKFMLKLNPHFETLGGGIRRGL